jgi:hypothetical protein
MEQNETVIPLIPLKLDRERHLRFDVNAMIALEEKTGLSVAEGLPSKMPLRVVRALLWASLVHEDEALTEVQVGSMIGPQNIAEVTAALRQAFRKRPA